MRFRLQKKAASAILSILLLFSALGLHETAAASKGNADTDAAASATAIKSDIAGHWAEGVMQKWIGLELLKGYGGKYKPNAHISRAEFVTILSRVLNLPRINDLIPFQDVPQGSWFYDSVASAYYYGLVNGKSASSFAPEATITRQDAAVIVARAFQLSGVQEQAAEVKDRPQIADYALAAVDALFAKQYLQGRGDQAFAPLGLLTRAEAAQLIDRVIGTWVTDASALQLPIRGNLLVSKPDTNLQGLVIEGDLYIVQGAQEGKVKLDGVTVKGSTYVLGGGAIEIYQSTLTGPLIVNKKAGDVRLIASGEANIPSVVMESGGLLEERGLKENASGFQTVTVNSGKPSEHGKVVLIGAFDQVTGAMADSELGLAEGTTVDRLLVDAPVVVGGQGTVKLAIFQTSGSVFSNWPEKVEFKPGVTATIESKLVDKDDRGSFGSGGGYIVTPPEVEDSLHIVQNGEPAAAIVISSSADKQIKEAADKLIDYVRKSTGAELPLVIDDSEANRITAQNGSITYKFDEAPAVVPVAADFKVQPIVNNEEAERIQPTALTWDAASLTATLTVPAVSVAFIEQTVAYKVFYKNDSPIKSAVMTIEENSASPLTLNADMEIGYLGGYDALPWRYWLDQPYTWTFKRSTEQARSGQYSIKASGIGTAWPNQEIEIAQYGEYELSAYLYRPSDASANGNATVFMNLLDKDGNHLSQVSSQAVMIADSVDDWLKLQWKGIIPETVNDVPVERLLIGLSFNDFIATDVVYFDDVELFYNGTASGALPDGAVADDWPGGVSADDMAMFSEGAQQSEKPTNYATLVSSTATEVYIGKNGLTAAEQTSLLDGMEKDGFVIHQNKKRITIAGPTSWGTEFGVSEFLERYVGVRWLMPGEIWEDVPQSNQISVPIGDEVREEPAFFSRTFEVAPQASHEQWKRDNKMHWHVDFGHNLYNLFPPAVYIDSNPEFYPAGADLNTIHTWQPCFTADGIVEEAIANINAYFVQHPEAESYSIGINDTTNFCEANPAHPDYPNKMNSIGMVDMSNIFFEWVNQVAAGVFAEHPDKYLGTYAYYNVYDPPMDIQIDPRVIVYITDDRLSWTDPDLLAEGHTVTEAWAQSGATVAFYEYLYGTPYMVPRMYSNLMQESYIYAAEKGVEAFYSELSPNVGEGPKGWLSMKLQWDPYQDKDALLEEWYVRAVGEDAAPDLQAYYEIWEQFWEEQLVDIGWYKAWKNNFPRTNFMPLFSAGYLKDVSEADMMASRALLESVVEKANTPKQKKRAEQIVAMFRYYELSVAAYPDLTKEFDEPTTEQEALALLQIAIDRLEVENDRLALMKQYENDEYLKITYAIYWDVISNNHIWAIVKWISDHPTGSTRQYIDTFLETAEAENVRQFMGKLITASFGAEVRNPGFEDGFDFWHDWPDTTAQITEDAHTGTKALRVERSSREQTIYLEGGKTYTLTFYGKQDGNASVANVVGVNFWNVPDLGMLGKHVSVTASEYTKYVVTFTSPQHFSHATIVAYRDPGEGAVYVDDFSIVEGAAPDDPVIASVTASNGQLEVQLEGIVPSPPTASNFIVQPVVNGTNALTEQPNSVVWDASAKKVTLTVSSLTATAGDQQLAYRVKYLSGAELLSEEMTINGVGGAPVNQNSSFEIGYSGAYSALPWQFWQSAGIISRTDEEARTGGYSLKVVGGADTFPIQNVKITETGDYTLTAIYKSSASFTGTEKITFFTKYLNETNGWINHVQGPSFSATDTAGDWVEMVWDFTVPATNNGMDVKGLFISMAFEGFTGQIIYIDDFELIKR
ncbi:DUF4838 domain-containing protein [Paenibacillus sp. IITD108]|uniref:DUF4838 domain-containing protein n=1 Tax=Paenibacillus sp. IITD108 TaxID=3116649 RepID=UPI002F3EC39C